MKKASIKVQDFTFYLEETANGDFKHFCRYESGEIIGKNRLESILKANDITSGKHGNYVKELHKQLLNTKNL
jgi:hypothetical protein